MKEIDRISLLKRKEELVKKQPNNASAYLIRELEILKIDYELLQDAYAGVIEYANKQNNKVL